MYSFRVNSRLSISSIILLLGLSACAPLPGQEMLNAGTQHSVQGDWSGLSDNAQGVLSLAEDTKITFLAHSALCESALWQGRYDAAMTSCDAAIRANPGFSGHPYGLRGRIFAHQKYYDWAIEELNIAIEQGGSRLLSSDDPGTIAVGAKARIYATSEDATIRNPELALQFAQKAIELEAKLTTPAYIILNRDTWAASLAANGQFEEAINAQIETMEMVRQNGWQSIMINNLTLEAFLGRHLALFEDGKSLKQGYY